MSATATAEIAMSKHGIYAALPDEIEAGSWQTTNADYHADTSAVSSSSLKVFTRWRPTYWAQYVAKTQPRPAATEDMNLGSAFHCQTIEPHKYDDLFAVAPRCDKRTNAGKALYADFCLASAGKTVLSDEQADKLACMVESWKADKQLSRIIECATGLEKSYRWQHVASGVDCKLRLDIQTPGIIWDIKTLSGDLDDDALQRRIANYGYDRQAAFYVEGVWTLQSFMPRFFHVWCQTTAPFGIRVTELDGEWIDGGRLANDYTLGELANCRATSDWRDPKQDGIKVLSKPKWASYKGVE